MGGALPSALMALAVALVSLTMLAPAPISGDGLEIADNLLQGGVLHPPGFPLQTWLHALLRHVPLGSGTLRVELMCLAGHCAAVFFVAETARTLGAGLPGRVAAAATVGCFPTVWPLGLQPEVFGLTHGLIAALVWQGVVLWTLGRPPRLGHAAALGALVALAAAQHPITITAAPAFLGSLWVLVRHREGRVARFLCAGVVFALLFCGLYLSLLWRNDDATWPNTHVTTVKDIIDLMLRRTYGTLSLGATQQESTSALWVLASWFPITPLAVVLAAAGAVAALRQRERGAPLVLMCVMAGTIFLWVARLPGPAESYLERFGGVAVIPAAVLVALGVELVTRASSSRSALIPWAVGAGAALSVFAVGFARADLSKRTEIDVFRRALGQNLPADAVWIAGTDREVLGGADHHGARRYPINFLFASSWYWTDTVARLEPRVRWPGTRLDGPGITALARAAGLSAASIDRAQIDPTNQHAHLRGLLWVVDGKDGDDVDLVTVQTAVALCPLVRELHSRAPRTPGFGRGVLQAFARAFDAAAVAAQTLDPARQPALAQVARALESGDDESLWQEACEFLSP